MVRAPPDNLDLIAVRLGQTYPFATARRVKVLDTRRAIGLRDFLEIFFTLRLKGQANEFRVTLVGDVDERRWIGATHIQNVIGSLSSDHTKIR